MNDSLVREVIEIIIETQYLSPESITVDSTYDELRIDSLSGLTIVAKVEKAYQVAIPNEQVLLIRDVRQMVETVCALLRSADPLVVAGEGS